MTLEDVGGKERAHSIRLFLACERKRRQARANGKSAGEAHHEAKEHWNNEVKNIGKVDFTNVRFEKVSLWAAVRTGQASSNRAVGRSKQKSTRQYYLDMKRSAASAPVFGSNIDFREFEFPNGATFNGALFTCKAHFEGVKFKGHTSFDNAVFDCDAKFDDACFEGDAWFYKTSFKADAIFYLAKFHRAMSFELATFGGNAELYASRYLAEASFRAIRAESAFTITKAHFSSLPNFVQAHFSEPPRLDDLLVEPRGSVSEGSQKNKKVERKTPDVPSIAAQWRALRRLASLGHDLDRELEFHAREMHALRSLEDRPWPRLTCRESSCGNTGRFWLGWLYGVFSNFGRSVGRPLGFWTALVVVGALFYASWSPGLEAGNGDLKKSSGTSAPNLVAGWKALLPLSGQSCYGGDKWTVFKHSTRAAIPPCGDKPDSDCKSNGDLTPYVGALSDSVRSSTSLGREAWLLSIRNALVMLDNSSDAAHRTYGCLYGVELYGGSNPVAVVPSVVSAFGAFQKLFSGVMIFLFGLALRNMLKMK